MTVNIVWLLSSCALVVLALKGLIWHYSFHLFLLIGLSKEGWHIFKNLAAELLILLFGFFTFVPAIQVNLYTFLDSHLCRRPRRKKVSCNGLEKKGCVLCMFYVEWELGGLKKLKGRFLFCVKTCLSSVTGKEQLFRPIGYGTFECNLGVDYRNAIFLKKEFEIFDYCHLFHYITGK